MIRRLAVAVALGLLVSACASGTASSPGPQAATPSPSPTPTAEPTAAAPVGNTNATPTPRPSLPIVFSDTGSSIAGYTVYSTRDITRITGSYVPPKYACLGLRDEDLDENLFIQLALSSGKSVAAGTTGWCETDGTWAGWAWCWLGQGDPVDVPFVALDGQRMKVTLTASGSQVTVTWLNETTGKTYVKQVSASGTGGGATWGFEPGPAGSQIPDFGKVTFRDVTVTVGGVSSGIRASYLQTHQVQYDDGLVKVVPSGLLSGNTGFTLTPSQS